MILARSTTRLFNTVSTAGDFFCCRKSKSIYVVDTKYIISGHARHFLWAVFCQSQVHVVWLFYVPLEERHRPRGDVYLVFWPRPVLIRHSFCSLCVLRIVCPLRESNSHVKITNLAYYHYIKRAQKITLLLLLLLLPRVQYIQDDVLTSQSCVVFLLVSFWTVFFLSTH